MTGNVVEQLREDRQIGAALRRAEELRPQGHVLLVTVRSIGATAEYRGRTDDGLPDHLLMLGAGSSAGEALERLVGRAERGWEVEKS